MLRSFVLKQLLVAGDFEDINNKSINRKSINSTGVLRMVKVLDVTSFWGQSVSKVFGHPRGYYCDFVEGGVSEEVMGELEEGKSQLVFTKKKLVVKKGGKKEGRRGRKGARREGGRKGERGRRGERGKKGEREGGRRSKGWRTGNRHGNNRTDRRHERDEKKAKRRDNKWRNKKHELASDDFDEF